MPPQARTAVLLDRYPLWHEAVQLVLTGVGVQVAAKTTSPEEALAAVQEHAPDLFITEIELGEGAIDGLTCIRFALEQQPRLRPIVLSLYDDPERIQAAFEAGAAAYVLKSADPEDLASAIRQAFKHSVYLAGVGPTPPPAQAMDGNDQRTLTRRELEILRLVAEGHSNRQLAQILWVTEQTVKFHLSNIYRKLNVSNRTEASRWAQLHGLLTAGTEQHSAGLTGPRVALED
jgi:DNA-binding NarL/FixJ family response regulator